MPKWRILAPKPRPVFPIYNAAVWLASALLRIPALFNEKISLFLRGRKEVWAYLASYRVPGRDLIWMHTASLGEFEQGLPVLERLRAEYPDTQILVTFFSPSGYEVKKDRLPGYGVCYLPLDTAANARRFVTLARPRLALFVKYEVWPNFFRELQAAGVPVLMLSARFKPNQAYFQWYGGFLKQALNRVTHFYVQDQASAQLLEQHGLTRFTVSGDTRFDRVSEIRQRDNRLDFMDNFKGNRTCLVAGSTWPEDEQVMLPLIRGLAAVPGHCFVIAPHKTDPRTIENLMEQFRGLAVLYSQREQADPALFPVLIVDTIGLLTKIYSYADLAYVGGGFATGLHNTLEPAVFGIPVMIGPRFQGFPEAEALVAAGGLCPVSCKEAFSDLARSWFADPALRARLGSMNRRFTDESTGASAKIMEGLRTYL